MSDILTSIRRTPYQSLAAFLVLFFTTFLSLSLFIGLLFLYSLLGYVETLPQVTAYFQPKTDEASILKVRDTLVESGKVWGDFEYIVYADSEEAYEDFYKNHPPEEWDYWDI